MGIGELRLWLSESPLGMGVGFILSRPTHAKDPAMSLTPRCLANKTAGACDLPPEGSAKCS